VIKTARKINDYMPKHIVKLTLKALKKEGKNIKNRKIAILGTAYKADIDDSRSSPSEIIILALKELGAKTFVYDPHCSNSFTAKKAHSIAQSVQDADCLLILVDHTEFKNLNLFEIKKIMKDNPILIDGKRIINPVEAEEHGFIYYGIGYNKLAIAKKREQRIRRPHLGDD
jgi:UDP-N-acetyl-D-mannosaminuronic acid dehydrogenase